MTSTSGDAPLAASSIFSEDRIAELLGYEFGDGELLQTALTHKSYSNESKRENIPNNERLEFLGDAVLELSITELLMNEFPDDSEGALSNKRSLLVNEGFLASIAEEIGLVKRLRLGRGEKVTQGHLKPRLLASALEAIFGALYAEAGFEKTKAVVKNLFQSKLASALSDAESNKDNKTRLQELIQKKFREVPAYELVNTDGPEHDKTFFVTVSVKEKVIGQGAGKTKKDAEQTAAREAWQRLES